jgi:hypothetical protein
MYALQWLLRGRPAPRAKRLAMQVAHCLSEGQRDHTYYCLQAALKYVAKAKVMGGKWVSYNELTERNEYLHLTQHTKSIFLKRWSMLCTTEVQGEKVQGQTVQGEKVQGEKVQGEKVQGVEVQGVEVQGKQAGKGSKRKASEVQGATNQNEAKEKTILDLLLAKAFATKRKYMNVSGQASAFLAQVQADEQFNWMSADILSPVHKAQAQLAEDLTPFFLHLASGAAMQQLKKEYPDESELEERLRNVSSLLPKVNALSKEVDRLLRMHSARNL